MNDAISELGRALPWDDAELLSLLGATVSEDVKTRARTVLKGTIEDRVAYLIYITQPEIRAGIDCISESVAASIRPKKDDKFLQFWKDNFMPRKIEMITASSMIFGRSISEPFPQWKVRDPRDFTIKNDDKGEWTSVKETVDGKARDLQKEGDLYSISVFVFKRLFSDDHIGISSLTSLVSTMNTIDDVYRGLRKFILTLWINKSLVTSPDASMLPERNEVAAGVNSLAKSDVLGYVLPPGYDGKLLPSGTAPSQLDTILANLKERYFAALRIPPSAIGLISGQYKYLQEEQMEFLSRRIRPVALNMIDFLEKVFARKDSPFKGVEFEFSIDSTKQAAEMLQRLSYTLEKLPDSERKTQLAEKIMAKMEAML